MIASCKKRLTFQLFPECAQNIYRTCVGRRPVKFLQQKNCDQSLAEEGINKLNSIGNLKPPPRRTIANWILEAWEEISPATIKNLSSGVV